ncbi:MAG: hypothetical protein A2754_03840 [Candidatus Magasanikbacteria bacterium RIFCSPHIGHO2_01_FULL_47_8]|uniref:UPF0102 protein A2754_03840 n=1 Tax=Candidatus Magasanikbacteria bacterium RIFCSPHIGHO2_01_FULL_47_8 TaxID=1798673 RepID=A0A1F6MCU5_9BACT|nr:MAG: hypothetical protein A2754_03840 [Candidatus Magasanikbacteria bacterium RIFCSPHIGHO2_01_FULL_47_8]
MRRNKDFGDWGEEQAAQFLRRQGFVVIDRNYHAVAGEIDIVAKKGGDYYFIEVKTRRAGELANDLAVTAAKRRKLGRVVKHYCFRHNIMEGSLISASLMVVADKLTRTVQFRLAVLY